MAQYLVLIYGDEQVWAERSDEQLVQNDAAHSAFRAAAGKALLGGKELAASVAATCVRTLGAGEFVISDGPFTEAREVIGGYYLLEVADLDEAIRLVKLIPEVSAPTSGVEIRPVVLFE